MKVKPIFVGLLITLIFFLISLFTLSDYNVNWDEPVHFMRGQAYLRYFLTGEKNYKNLPSSLPRLSIYQSNTLDGEYFLENDSGHPPLNGILAALTNYIFYQKLGILGDIEAYHLFIILVSTCLAFLIFYWAREEYGLFAGVVAFLSLTFYPLFFGESHNNIKDPVEASFFAFALYGFYKGIKCQNWRWIIFSSLFAGFALGTKFNILFLPFILFPWLLALGIKKIFSKKFALFFLVYPFIVLVIFFASWPFLWQEPIFNLLKTFGYYKEIGTGAVYQPQFIVAGFSTYPLQAIIFTTPLVVLFFSFIGIIGAFANLRKKQKTSFLWLLWFLIPIMRVSLPGASIYGGVRQIMEYIPAMALLTGLGASSMVTWLHGYMARIKKPFNHLTIQLLILLMFLPITFKIISIHPNQNLYFNPLIGGLQGAAEKNFPGWGITLGNPYLQGVKWLNQNVEPNAKLVLSLGMMTNVPKIKLREDIEFSNALESLTWREGEYIMGLTYYSFPLPYDTQYPERYLEPVWEKKVEGMSILKIWKNDLAHTKNGFVAEKDITSETKIAVEDYGLLVDFQKPVFLTRMEVFLDPKKTNEIKWGVISTSLDGVSWDEQPEGLSQNQIPRVQKLKNGMITHFFAAIPARFLKIKITPFDRSYLRVGNSVKITTLRDLKP